MDINFVYSPQYQSFITNGAVFPSSRAVKAKIRMLNSFWKKDGAKIKSAIKDATGLSFKEGTIDCFVNTKGSVSYPLSLRISDNATMKNDLIHELQHILLTQNYPQIKKGWGQLQRTFKDEAPLTRSHILVHSIHLLVVAKLWPRKIHSVIYDSKHKDYVRSWDLVLEKTPIYLVQKYLM